MSNPLYTCYSVGNTVKTPTGEMYAIEELTPFAYKGLVFERRNGSCELVLSEHSVLLDPNSVLEKFTVYTAPQGEDLFCQSVVVNSADHELHWGKTPLVWGPEQITRVLSYFEYLSLHDLIGSQNGGEVDKVLSLAKSCEPAPGTLEPLAPKGGIIGVFDRPDPEEKKRGKRDEQPNTVVSRNTTDKTSLSSDNTAEISRYDLSPVIGGSSIVKIHDSAGEITSDLISETIEGQVDAILRQATHLQQEADESVAAESTTPVRAGNDGENYSQRPDGADLIKRLRLPSPEAEPRKSSRKRSRRQDPRIDDGSRGSPANRQGAARPSSSSGTPSSRANGSERRDPNQMLDLDSLLSNSPSSGVGTSRSIPRDRMPLTDPSWNCPDRPHSYKLPASMQSPAHNMSPDRNSLKNSVDTFPTTQPQTTQREVAPSSYLAELRESVRNSNSPDQTPPSDDSHSEHTTAALSERLSTKEPPSRASSSRPSSRASSSRGSSSRRSETFGTPERKLSRGVDIDLMPTMREGLACEVCGERFRKLKPWRDHVAGTHGGRNRLKCRRCSYAAGTVRDFYHHLWHAHARGLHLPPFEARR